MCETRVVIGSPTMRQSKSPDRTMSILFCDWSVLRSLHLKLEDVSSYMFSCDVERVLLWSSKKELDEFDTNNHELQ